MRITSLLFTILVNTVTVRSDRMTFERNVLSVLAHDILREDPEGKNITIDTIRSIKVAMFFKRAGILRDVSVTDNNANATYPFEQITIEHEADRNIMTYFDKVWFLSELADDPKMKNICEIGFDKGYSSLNFLLANPVARMISLDSYEHDYVPKGVKTLMEMFPHRELFVVRGDSRQSASRLAKLLKEGGSLCNLVYIDGGQTTSILRHDVANMKRLLDPTFHRVVIDGIDDPRRAVVWDALLKSEHFVDTQVVQSGIFNCIVWNVGPQGASDDTNTIIHDDLSAPYVFSFGGGPGCSVKERGGAMGVGSFTQAHLEPCAGIPLVLPGNRRDGLSFSHVNDGSDDVKNACSSTEEFGWVFHDDDPPPSSSASSDSSASPPFCPQPPQPSQQQQQQQQQQFPSRVLLPYLTRLRDLREGCGDVCNTTMTGTTFHPYFNEIRKHVDCPALLANSAIDASRPHGPPPDLPWDMVSLFSYDGRVRIDRYDDGQGPMLFNEQSAATGGENDERTPVWSKSMVDEWTKQCRDGTLEGTYGKLETAYVYQGLQQMTAKIRNGSVMVIGSLLPWIEACLLAVGAKMVTVVEYRTIISEHPQIRTMTPAMLQQEYADYQQPLYDALVTFSSVEHSGLGRFGDDLNPWGDLQTMARGWCILRPGALLLIGVMTAHDNVDRIEFNAHRVYGPVMFSHLLANFRLIWRASGGEQIVHVLKKLDVGDV